MSILKNYPNGSNIVLLNTFYERPKKIDGKYTDKLHIVYKDLDTDKKYIEVIKNPEMDIYFSDDDIHYNVLQPHVPIETVHAVTTPYKDVLRTIASEADRRNGTTKFTDFFWRCLTERQMSRVKKLHNYKYVHSSDIDIEDYVRMQFLKDFKPKKIEFSKSFFDIETDILHSASNRVSDLIENPDAPVNAVTIIHQKLNKAYTFLLRNPDNPQIQELEDDIDDFIKEVNETFDKDFGVLDYNILFYDDEIELIKDMFRNFHIIKPDFALVWNMDFDIRYIINRLEYLGIDPASIMTHPDFELQKCYYYKDTRNFKIAEKDDFMHLSSYTIFMDQMVNYAKVNKGGSELPSFSLDYVSRVELGDEKLKYDSEGDFATFCYRDYRKFVLYNIKDVLLLLGIEKKTEHTDLIYLRSYDSGTRLNKVFRPSVFLKNTAHIEYPKDEIRYILGNNHNIDYKDFSEIEAESQDSKTEVAKEKFEGAIVGNPLNNTNNGIVINSHKSKFIFKFTIDFDYKALYPNCRDSHNICVTTQYGKLNIDEPVSDLENMYDSDRYNRGGNFLDDYQTRNLFMIGLKWFNLPSVKDVIEAWESNSDNLSSKKTMKDLIKEMNINPIVEELINSEKFELKLTDNSIAKSKTFKLKLMDDFINENTIVEN